MFHIFKSPKAELEVRFHLDSLHSPLSGMIQVTSKKHHLSKEVVPFSIYGYVDTDPIDPSFVKEVFISAKYQGYTPHAIVQMNGFNTGPLVDDGFDIKEPRLKVNPVLLASAAVSNIPTTDVYVPIAQFTVVTPGFNPSTEEFVLEASNSTGLPIVVNPTNIEKLFNAVAECRKIPVSLTKIYSPMLAETVELGAPEEQLPSSESSDSVLDIPSYLRKSNLRDTLLVRSVVESTSSTSSAKQSPSPSTGLETHHVVENNQPPVVIRTRKAN